jgi:hypothetical protein
MVLVGVLCLVSSGLRIGDGFYGLDALYFEAGLPVIMINENTILLCTLIQVLC